MADAAALFLTLLKRIGTACANALRSAVRCAFPLVTLAVFALFVWVLPQGRDLLAGLAERAASDRFGYSVAGLLWLGGACTALGLSLWYTMRWLLAAQMPGVPLPPPGRVACWLPRLFGALPAGLVASGLLLPLQPMAPEVALQARHAALGFGLLGLAILVFAALRGQLMQMLDRRGLMGSTEGRAAADGLHPAALEANQALPPVTQVIIGWSLGLSALLTLVIVRFPVGVPQDLGAAAIAGFALASINLFGSFVLSWWPLRQGLPHLAPWAIVITGTLGWFNDNHGVQPAPLPMAAPAERPTLDARFAAHLQHQGGNRPPVIFVASEGGGIRAAYWTAEVLSALARQVPDWPARDFALSGVSGGSLGLASWLARERSVLCPTTADEHAAGLRLDPGPPQTRHLLGADFLAPPVAGMLFYDLIQRFWPWPVGAFDRSRALESAWQRAHAALPGRPFERPLAQWYQDCEILPELMLNATTVETGQRVVLTRLKTDAFVHALAVNGQDPMAAAFDTSRQSVAGLVHHSARFPALSPAGRVPYDSGGERGAVRLVDGGYFDNSGAQTLADLIQHLCEAHDFRPLVLLVRNTPECLDGGRPADTATRCDVAGARRAPPPAPGGLFPETGSIFSALYNARSAHAVAARLALQARLGADLIDLAVPATDAAAEGPLGWVLSESAQRAYDSSAQRVAADAAIQLRARLQADTAGCRRMLAAPAAETDR